MALKTFNIDNDIYNEFSRHCRKNGISMSKKIENFIKEEMKKLEMSLNKVGHTAENHANEHHSEHHEASPDKLKEHSFMKFC